MSKPMTNYNERLDEVIGLLNARMPQPKTMNEAKARVAMCHEAKQALTSLIKELVEEAKPSKKTDTRGATQNPNNAFYHTKKAQGYNEAIDQFEQNLLKGLESK